MSGIRKSYSGAAAATTLNGQINSTAASGVLAAIVNFPDTTVGPFVITIDRGTSAEEKILCSSYTGTTVNFSERGYDGTVAQAHGNDAPVVCTLDAITIDQANDIVNGVGSVTPTTSEVGDSAVEGTSEYPAAADHQHGRENFASGATSTLSFGETPFDGTSTSPARADHSHGMPTSGGGGGSGVSWPIGMAGPWMGPLGTIPSGFFPLDGRTVSRTTYSLLYTALGGSTSPWGQGDGSTTFQIPLMPTGANMVQVGTAYPLAGSGGSITPTLTAAMIPFISAASTTLSINDPTHSHTTNDPTHVHGMGTNEYTITVPTSTLWVVGSGDTNRVDAVSFTPSTGAASTGVSVNSASTGVALNGGIGTVSPGPIPLPLWMAVNHVIRAI